MEESCTSGVAKNVKLAHHVSFDTHLLKHLQFPHAFKQFRETVLPPLIDLI